MSSIEAQKVCLEEVMPLILQTLSAGKSVQFKPKGSSMLPMLRPGMDSVVLSPISGELKKYDIVLYRREHGGYVLHRINDAADAYICMGDNQFHYENIQREQIIAVVTAFYRGEKKHEVKEAGYQLYCRIWPTRRRFRLACLYVKKFLRSLLHGGKK